MNTLRVGVIGLGIGVQHLRCYQALPGVEIAAAGDQVESVVRQRADEFHARAYTDPLAMLEKERLDAVSLCTPPKSHRELTEAAARAGTHVLCEKPMAPSLADCDAMMDACRRAGVLLMIAQKKRFHPFVQRTRAAIESDFGPIRWAVAKYALGRVPKDWFWQENDGGGPLLENTIHTVDQLRYLMGEVSTVYAEGDNLFNPAYRPQIDVAAFTLRFANGSIAAVGAGQATEWAFANEFFFFACDGGEIRFSGPFDRPDRWWLGRRDQIHACEEESLPPFDAFRAEIEHFLHCVRTGEKPLIPGPDGRASVAVCLAVKESARARRPITPGA
ncbi:MAG: Gfo/Idh/MocA family oxidoreductase [Planctomycetes bacterium]|nr:Gfo/Idh/MocA family oxidoreductase [Planctomycetota bacterium]